MADRHLIIAGQGRAGSTLFYNMLRHCLRDFHLPDGEMSAVALRDRTGNVCTKRPFDILQMPQLVAAFGGRKQLDLIVTLRDPRDILTSRHRAVPGDYFYGADRCYQIYPDRAPTLTAPGFLQVHKGILDTARSGLFPQGIFYLKYEDLVAHPEEVQTLLAEGFDLRFEGQFRDFTQQNVTAELDKALNGLRPLEAGRVAKWRAPEHRDRIVDQFTRFPVMHDILISLGYEKDQRWFESLRDGAPLASAAHPAA